jgi:hypothetical protein
MSPRSRPWGSRAWRWRQRQGKPAAFHAVACSNPMCRGGASSRDLASVVTDWLMTPSVRAPRAGPVLVAPGPFQLVAVVFEERGVRFVPERERDLGRGGASAHDTRGGQHGHERGDDLSVRCTGGLRLLNAGDERRRISVETDQRGEPRQRAVLWSSSMASPPERSRDEMKRSSQSAILAKVSPSPGMRSTSARMRPSRIRQTGGNAAGAQRRGAVLRARAARARPQPDPPSSRSRPARSRPGGAPGKDLPRPEAVNSHPLAWTPPWQCFHLRPLPQVQGSFRPRCASSMA